MVPTLMCGLVRSNFCLPIASLRGSSRLLRTFAFTRHDRLCDRGRYFFVTIELHAERRAALGHRAQVGRVAEHLREWNTRSDRLRPTDRLEVLDPATTAVQVTNDVTQVLLRRDDLDGHHGLEEPRPRPPHSLLERHGARGLEGPLARVDLVVRAVDELHIDVDHRQAGQDTGAHRLLDYLIGRRDELARAL